MQEAAVFMGLKAICGEESLIKDALLREYTSMRVGGPADLMVQPRTLDEVQAVVSFLSENGVPYMVIGNGSNLIFSDAGYRGVILKIGPRLSKISVDGTIITAEAGASLAAIANRALEFGLTGLEFASGIPGTIGGGAVMNAGAYDGELKQVITETTSLDPSGKLVTLRGEEHAFSYRHSRIQDEALTVLTVTMSLQPGDKQAIQAKMNDLNGRRRDKQPLNLPSAGSVFKRPEGHFAGKLIEDCGLRGYSVGGAQVSEKHCGFIVNKGNAKASDIIELINYIQKIVQDKTGVQLEPEVKIIGGEA